MEEDILKAIQNIPEEFQVVKLVIEGQLPDLNEYTYLNRKSKGAGAAMKKQAERKIRAAIMRQLEGTPTMKKVRMVFKWYASSARKDPDNVVFAKKFILDALVSEKILKGDGWNNILGLKDQFYLDAENARIEVYIIPEELE